MNIFKGKKLTVEFGRFLHVSLVGIKWRLYHSLHNKNIYKWSPCGY